MALNFKLKNNNLSLVYSLKKITPLSGKLEIAFGLEGNKEILKRVARVAFKEEGLLIFELDGRIYKAHMAQNQVDKSKTITIISNKKSSSIEIEKLPPKLREVADAKQTNTIGAPLAGKVIKKFVQEGQLVKKNEQICIIEAMKMENEIRAHMDLFIKTIPISEGDLVKPNQILVTFESQV